MKLSQALERETGTISLKDAAELLECDPRTLKKSIDSGKIQTIQIGTRKLILRIPFLKAIGVYSDTDRDQHER